MTKDQLLQRIDTLTIWGRGSQRAPHKPLLLLLALGRLAHGVVETPFAECETKLTDLLREFGPTGLAHHPEYPFWRLRQDGLWTVSPTSLEDRQNAAGDVSRAALRQADAVGRFPGEVLDLLRGRPAFVSEIAGRLLAAHFPESIHPDIVAEVGLATDAAQVRRQRRDPRFRERVLVAYGYRCVVCGFDVRINNLTVGLEAAHIQWYQAQGPDEETNGLALCAVHHKLFDFGAFLVEPSGQLLVSEHVNGGGIDETLLRFHRRRIARPARNEQAPAERFLDWHRREVFKERPRQAAPD